MAGYAQAHKIHKVETVALLEVMVRINAESGTTMKVHGKKPRCSRIVCSKAVLILEHHFQFLECKNDVNANTCTCR